MRTSTQLLGAVSAFAALSAFGAGAPRSAVDKLVDTAQAEFSAHRYYAAQRALDAALKRDPDHPGANFTRCTWAMFDADIASRGDTDRDKVVNQYRSAAAICGHAAERSDDASRESSALGLQLRALLACASWSDAAAVLELLIEGSPDDGRFVGGYAAALDRAGRTEESGAAMGRAAARGPEFDRAARFEFVWDRFEPDDAERIGSMIAALEGEETDPRRRAVLRVLHAALTAGDENLLLEFLELVETKTLNRPELDKLWLTIAGPPGPSEAPWTRRLKAVPPDIELPVLVKRVDPVYPRAAARARVEGHVIVLARINVDGSVAPVWIVRTTSQDFVSAAVEAISARRYRPATRLGEPIAIPFTIRVAFKIP